MHDLLLTALKFAAPSSGCAQDTVSISARIQN